MVQEKTYSKTREHSKSTIFAAAAAALAKIPLAHFLVSVVVIPLLVSIVFIAAAAAAALAEF